LNDDPSPSREPIRSVRVFDNGKLRRVYGLDLPQSREPLAALRAVDPMMREAIDA
jgi:hypothetical protein